MMVGIYNKNIENSLTLPSGKASFGVIDQISAFLIAVSPILQHYKGLYENAGFTVLIVAVLLLLPGLFSRHGIIHIKTEIIPLVLFEFYTFVARNFSFSRLLYVGFFVFLFLLIADGYVNFSLFFRYATRVCIIATILIYVQYIAYYLFGIKLSMRPLNLLVSQDVIWVRNAASASSTLTRTSAFFLEPSHMFLYMFPVIYILVLSPGMNKKRFMLSVFLTSGLLLTLSGFGIVASVMVWTVYYMFYNRNDDDKPVHSKRKVPVKAIIIPLFILSAVVIAYFVIPNFAYGVNRILDSTAFDGRVRLARNYVKQITGSRVLTGRAGVIGDLDFNLSGFFATYIKWGIIGIVLTYWYYLQGLFKLKNAYFWITVIIFGISFFTAHTHGTFYMLYYVTFFSMGYHTSFQKDNDISL